MVDQSRHYLNNYGSNKHQQESRLDKLIGIYICLDDLIKTYQDSGVLKPDPLDAYRA